MTDPPATEMDQPIRKYLVPCPKCGKHLSMLMFRGGDIEKEIDGKIVHACGAKLKMLMVLLEVDKEQVLAEPTIEVNPEGYG